VARRSVPFVLAIGELETPYERTKAFSHAIDGCVVQRFFIVYEVEPETPEGFVAVDLTLVGITRPYTPLYRLDPVLRGSWYVVFRGLVVIRQESIESPRRSGMKVPSSRYMVSSWNLMVSRRWRTSLVFQLFPDSAAAARSRSFQKALFASQSWDSARLVSIEAPGPNERMGNARFLGTGREANVGSVGVVGLRGGRPAWPRPVMFCGVMYNIFLDVDSEGMFKQVKCCCLRQLSS
jgi:hypothetical protein